MKFKDKCDKCGKFDYLKSVKNQCLCSSCREKPIKSFKQLTIYDVDMEGKNGKNI